MLNGQLPSCIAHLAVPSLLAILGEEITFYITALPPGPLPPMVLSTPDL